MKSRLRILDGLRGYFLLMMTFVHVNGFMENPLYQLSHHGLGFVEDAQGFVFLSGLVIGIVYTPYLHKYGLKPLKVALFRRLRLVYAYHVGVAVLIVLLVLFGSDHVNLPEYSGLQETPLRGTIMTALLVSGPRFVDILPMYVVFIAVTPLVLSQLKKGRTISVLATSVCLWLIAQTELIEYLFQISNQAIGLQPELGLQLGMTFDRTAWQLVYICGVVIGYHWTQNTIDLDFFKTDQGRYIALLSFIVFLCFVILKDHQGAAYRLFPMLKGALNRWDFAILRLGNFVADAYLLVWFIVAAPSSRWALIRVLARALRWLLNTEALCLLGRHSLQVYAYHVVLIYVSIAFIDWDAMQGGVKFLISSFAIFSIYLAAISHVKYQQSKRVA